MEPLTPEEARVLGVLIEKQMTTPDQYPLTLNSLIAGSNQKSNRSPVLELDEDTVHSAADALREKGLVVVVEQAGARVSKFKHLAAEKLACRPAELALLAELLLRGPQSAGELRSRASRMQAFEFLPATEGFLRSMMERETPLVARRSAAPGTRAEKYAQLLSLDSDATESSAEIQTDSTLLAEPSVGMSTAGLVERVATLESDMALLREAMVRLAKEIGAADPTL